MLCVKQCRRRKFMALVTSIVIVLVCYSVFMRPYDNERPRIKKGRHPKLFWLEQDDTNWPYNLSTTIKCPDIDFTHAPFQRKKKLIHCNGNEAKFVTTHTSDPSDIQIIDKDDECLGIFIKNHCYDNRPVPKVVHYIWYADREITIFNFVSFLSVIRFMSPCLVVFHGPFIPRGQLWNFFVRMYPNVVSMNRTQKMEVYGQRLLYKEHASDVMRIEILAKYGGLYIDWDEILLKHVGILRNHPFTMGLERPHHLGNQFIMAEPDAAFLKQWYYGYKNYSARWDYNSIIYPYQLAQKYPKDIHIVRYTLLKPRSVYGWDLWYSNSDWSANYALHLYLRGYKESKSINAANIGTLNSTIGSVCRYVLYGRKEICTCTSTRS